MLKMSDYPVVDRDADIDFCVENLFNANALEDTAFVSELK